MSTRLACRNVVERGKWYVRSSRCTAPLHVVDNDAELVSRRIVRNVDITPSVLAWLKLPFDHVMDDVPLAEVEKPKHRRNDPVYRAVKLFAKLEVLD